MYKTILNFEVTNNIEDLGIAGHYYEVFTVEVSKMLKISLSCHLYQ
ncbi:hypothetical protein [Niallia sp. 01092]